MSSRAERPAHLRRPAYPRAGRAFVLLVFVCLAVHLLGGWRAGTSTLAAQGVPGQPQPAGEPLDDPCLPAQGISLAVGDTALLLLPPPGPTRPWPAAAPLLPPPIA